MSQRTVPGPAAAPFLVAILFLSAASASPLAAQGPAAPAPATPSEGYRDGRRLFQRFAEDSAIITGGWIEGVFNYDNEADGAQRFFAGGQFAFRLGEQAEAGLRLGWAKQDSDDGPHGSGLDDIDIYGKFRFRGAGRRCAAGGLVKVATGDEEQGIGTGATDVEGFFACRGDFAAVTLAGNLGARYNGDPDPPLPQANASMLAGGALIIPAGARTTFVIEATWESERLDGAGSDARLTLGYSGAGPEEGFGFRGAIALPLADGAPDYEVLFGAVWVYGAR
jgi:hypothetical protein